MREKGLNWNDLPAAQKRGRGCLYGDVGGWAIDADPPMFTKDRAYLTQRITPLVGETNRTRGDG
jgi:hypothetical protein